VEIEDRLVIGLRVVDLVVDGGVEEDGSVGQGSCSFSRGFEASIPNIELFRTRA
jgi:hypothetical protein